MKSITVKGLNGVWIFSQPECRNLETGEIISQTEEEVEQGLYQQLIDRVKREEFERNLISLLENYLGGSTMGNWIDLRIAFHYPRSTDKALQMIIINK